MRGIDKFKERFADHDGEHVLIGGAYDLLFSEAGQDFRATKDLDLVLSVEALTPEFGQVFWDFVKEGGYENRQKSSEKPQFYRFSKPEDPAFPPCWSCSRAPTSACATRSPVSCRSTSTTKCRAFRRFCLTKSAIGCSSKTERRPAASPFCRSRG